MDDPTRRDFNADLVAAGLLGLAPLAACAPAAAFEPCRVMSRKDWRPAYLSLPPGELDRRAQFLQDIYKSCRLCPRACGVNRTRGEKGVCGGASTVKVFSAHPHYGEERPLSGRRGSGTIFFSHCSLRCVFCQNWEINHRGDGVLLRDDQLAQMMLDLQQRGCHNINLVTPTHYLPNIINALRFAIPRGLRLPLVYNCGGYEPLEMIQLLEGIVDIYLPDYKYTDNAMAEKYSSGASGYAEVAAEAIAEMHRQVGELVVDEQGIALRGLIIRHLVLPENIAGTDRFARWVATRLSPGTYVNIMGQYRPEYQAHRYAPLSRRVSRQEMSRALNWAIEAGLTRIDS